MNNLEQITAGVKSCDNLLKLGIIPAAFLWWLPILEQTEQERKESGTIWEVCPVVNPKPGAECVPAWTKAELDVMIGPDFSPKPDLFTKGQLGTYNLAEPESYPVYFVSKMQVFENGAEASAAALIFLIEEGHVKPVEANHRLQKVFRPFKK